MIGVPSGLRWRRSPFTCKRNQPAGTNRLIRWFRRRSGTASSLSMRVRSGGITLPRTLTPRRVCQMSEDFQLSPDTTVERFVGLNQILPCQYFDVSGGHRLTGEQRLMLALLADALNVYQQGVLSRNTRKRLLFIDAERWITASAKCRHAFSFDTVCDALGVNPGVLRRRMVAWKHELRRNVETRAATPHLRLKITPRDKHVSERRRRHRAQMSVPAF